MTPIESAIFGGDSGGDTVEDNYQSLCESKMPESRSDRGEQDTGSDWRAGKKPPRSEKPTDSGVVRASAIREPRAEIVSTCEPHTGPDWRAGKKPPRSEKPTDSGVVRASAIREPRGEIVATCHDDGDEHGETSSADISIRRRRDIMRVLKGDLVDNDIMRHKEDIFPRRKCWSSYAEGNNTGPIDITGDAASLPPRADASLRNRRMSELDLSSYKGQGQSPRSLSRTKTLLKLPAFRRKISRALKLDPNSDNFDEQVLDKLCANQDSVFSSPSTPRGHHPIRRRLCSSISDLSQVNASAKLQELRRSLAVTDADLGHDSVYASVKGSSLDGSTHRAASEGATVSMSDDKTQQSKSDTVKSSFPGQSTHQSKFHCMTSLEGLKPLEGRSKDAYVSDPLHIPTFSEYRLLKRNAHITVYRDIPISAERSSDKAVTEVASSRDVAPSAGRGVAPSAARDVAPSAARDVAPSAGRGVAPSAARDVAPSATGDVAPSAGRDVAPSAPRDVAPSAARDVAPSAGRDVAPSAGRDVAPSAARGVAPSAGRDVAPSAARDVAPLAGRDVAPSAGRDVAPSAARDVAPLAGRDVAPLAGRDVAPSAGRDVAPSAARDVAPSAGRDVAPSAARDVAPSAARDVAPSAGRDVAPSAARDVAPSAARDVAPSAARVVAPSASTKAHHKDVHITKRPAKKSMDHSKSAGENRGEPDIVKYQRQRSKDDSSIAKDSRGQGRSDQESYLHSGNNELLMTFPLSGKADDSHSRLRWGSRSRTTQDPRLHRSVGPQGHLTPNNTDSKTANVTEHPTDHMNSFARRIRKKSLSMNQVSVPASNESDTDGRHGDTDGRHGDTEGRHGDTEGRHSDPSDYASDWDGTEDSASLDEVFHLSGDANKQLGKQSKKHKSIPEGTSKTKQTSSPTTDESRRQRDLKITSKSVHFESSPLGGVRQSSESVLRSPSDVSDLLAEEARTKGTRDKRLKANKSDPLNPGPGRTGLTRGDQARQTNDLDLSSSCHEELQNILEEFNALDDLLDPALSNSEGHLDYKEKRTSGRPPLPKHRRQNSKSGRNKDSPAQVERTDSGVGHEITDTGDDTTKTPTCGDCSGILNEDDVIDSVPPGGSNVDTNGGSICRLCGKRRKERKEAIQEIVATEINYGNDMQIIKEEFYDPLKNSGLMTAEQMQTIFNNVNELMAINTFFVGQLQDAVDTAKTQGDQHYMSVNIGKLFLESSNMILAFESYCIRQSASPILLDQLLDEKEILRIFLEVSQQEKSVLRKMDLKAFLMVPVQRIMKYPLLLGRLYKVTPFLHEDRENIRRAQKKIENILELINANTKGSASVRMRKRLSSSLKRLDNMENMELHKTALDVLGWDRHGVQFARVGRLMYTTPPDHMWAKKGKQLKFQPLSAVLAILGKMPENDVLFDTCPFPRDTEVKDAALVLIREKAGKYIPLREPLSLKQSIVSRDEEFPEVFEVSEASKPESFLFKGEYIEDTNAWFKQIKRLTTNVSRWRHRRNGLANIMLSDSKKST